MSIASLLFSEYRRRVLGLLLLHPEARYHVREIARLTCTTPGTLNRELVKLANVGLLHREVSGKQVYYYANRTFSIFEELVSILKKTSGLIDVVANTLATLADKIDNAFIYGSMARNTENSGSDVDVLLIGNIGFAEAVAALHPAQEIIGREINPKVYQKTEWKKLVDKKNPFVIEILKNPKIFIIGDEHDIK